jgi:hypothetical protein
MSASTLVLHLKEKNSANPAHRDRGLTLENVAGGNLYNDGRSGDPITTYHFKDTFKYTHTRSWTHTLSDAWHIGVGIEIEHEINLIAIDDKIKLKGDFFWERKDEKSSMDGFTKEVCVM